MKSLDVRNIPSLAGKTIFVTGGTAGLGRHTVAELARHDPARIYFSGRNEKTARSAIDAIRADTSTSPKMEVSFIKCDQASIDSCRNATQELLQACGGRLDIVICNAGIMAVPPSQTKEGYEIQFGVNHMGHAAILKSILPALLETASTHGDARVILLSSRGASFANTIPLTQLKSDCKGMNTWKRYAISKLANILYGAELARQYPNLSVAVVHPGVIATDLVETLGFLNRLLVYVTNIGNVLSVDEGVQNSLWAATAPKAAIESGTYYEPVGKPGKHTRASQDSSLATQLWDWTEKELLTWS